MIYWRLTKVSLSSLWGHKLRTFLSTLGLIIGVGAVIAVIALGNGAKQQMTRQMQNIGTNLVIVRAGQHGRGGRANGSFENMKLADAEQILSKVDNIKMISPVVYGRVQAKYMSKNTSTALLGTTATYFKIRNFVVDKGRQFTDDDMTRKFVVIGYSVRDNLFEKDEDPIGRQIKINGINYTVIGILKTKGDHGWYNPDDQVIIPLGIAMKQILGQDYLREIDVMIDDLSKMDDTIKDIESLLRRLHKIQPGKDDDFYVRNVAEMVETANTLADTFKYLLLGIAAISLIVGGIGIMNIMLVSVTERTREIGIRKALGAREKDIMFQFLLEAILVCALGGAVGIVIGISSAYISDKFLPFKTQIDILSIIIAFGFSNAVGIFFGYYPARLAAKLNPIEALRHE